MSKNFKKGLNGTATESTTENTNVLLIEAPKPELSNIEVIAKAKEEQPEPQPPIINFLTAFEKTQQLIKLRDARERLLYAQDNLSVFENNRNEESGLIELNIKDKRGNSFNTANVVLVTEVIEFLNLKISDKLSEVENQIVSIF